MRRINILALSNSFSFHWVPSLPYKLSDEAGLQNIQLLHNVNLHLSNLPYLFPCYLTLLNQAFIMAALFLKVPPFILLVEYILVYYSIY